MEKDNTLTPFEGKNIRRIWHDEQWYISVVDVIEILTDSTIPCSYSPRKAVARNLRATEMK